MTIKRRPDINFILAFQVVVLMLFQAFGIAQPKAEETKKEPSKPVYIQAIHIDLRENPKNNASAVGSVSRGDSASVLETAGNWLKVKSGKKVGWISRLFVTPHRPVGNADLMKDVKENLTTSSRRRPSSYAVSATARGLMTSERGREGREMYETDGDALEAIEKYSLPKDAIKNFSASGKLTVE